MDPLYDTKSFNRLKLFKDKVVFFIATTVATKEEKLHFKVSKTISFKTQNQINMKMNLFSLPF